jgi:thiamine biosynthesis protein ThiS
MINDRIIKRERWSEETICEGDRIEVIHMVGGG